MKKFYNYVLLLGIFFSLFYFFNPFDQKQSEIVHTVYGDVLVTEPVLLDLLHSNAFQRLQKINQYGVDTYIRPNVKPYSRYTHSLGVFYLLRKFGASLDEQMAGLLHDVSHTVFSHVGDHVLAQLQKRSFDQNEEAYQDCMHISYLKQTDIADILQKHQVPIEKMDHKCGEYKMLECSYPDICADRLEYVLFGGYIEGWLSEKDMKKIVSSLKYQDEKWVFTNLESAKKFSEFSLRLCEEIFAAGWNIGSYQNAAKALLRAIDINLISMHDVHFGVDDEIWNLLIHSEDEQIKKYVQEVLSALDSYDFGTEAKHDITYIGKFRGIDPLVLSENKIVRASEIDDQFATYFSEAKKRVATTHFYILKENAHAEKTITSSTVLA